MTEAATVWQVGLHMHGLGSEIRTRHIRNTTELPTLGSKKYFDFNYQARSPVAASTELLLQGSDSLLTQCIYNSLGRVTATSYGQDTQSEMWVVFTLQWNLVDSTWSTWWCAGQEDTNTCKTDYLHLEFRQFRQTGLQNEDLKVPWGDISKLHIFWLWQKHKHCVWVPLDIYTVLLHVRSPEKCVQPVAHQLTWLNMYLCQQQLRWTNMCMRVFNVLENHCATSTSRHAVCIYVWICITGHVVVETPTPTIVATCWSKVPAKEIQHHTWQSCQRLNDC